MFSRLTTEFLDLRLLGNTVQDYLWCIGIILVGLIFKKIISRFLSLLLFRLFKRYSSGASAQEFLILLTRPFSMLVLLIIGYLAFNNLSFPLEWKIGPEENFGVRMVIGKVYKMTIIFSIIWIMIRIVDFFGLILMRRAANTSSKLDDQLVPFFKDGLKIFIVILGFFFTLAAVFEVNIVTLIGGLGIGGLAVALAAKETLENLLGSFTIFLDKPFIVGDHVKVGSIAGHIEKIGLRSTRIRTLDKSIITVPNKKMVDAELENITERTSWRARIVLNLLYSTSQTDLNNIIHVIRNLLNHHPMIKPGAAVNFDTLGTSSIEVLVIYLVDTTNADEFAKVKEEINFNLMEIVRKNHSDFAFPTTSVFIEKKT